MAARKRATAAPPTDAHTAVEAILADPRVVWFPVKHFSAACAHHVGRVIREVRPAAVLVEGPNDATALIDHLVDDETAPPVTVFSSYVDRDNRFGLNGVLSPAEHTPARYRAWWPMTAYAPEYEALRAGREVGAALAFIDLPLPAMVPFEHAPRRVAQRAVDDAHLARSAYFQALQTKTRARSFEEFWSATFESPGLAMETHAFMRAVLTFAWCARAAGSPADGSTDPSLTADGTLAREGHMRACIDDALAAHPGGRVVVVTGAFHSVALPWTVKARAKLRSDRNLETWVTAHSFPALASLYGLNRLPAWTQAAWEAHGEGDPRPFDRASLVLLTEIMRRARDAREPVSTADAVAAWRVARDLATLRAHREVTVEDLADAVQTTFVKGDVRVRGAVVERVAREVLVGRRAGRVTPAAGRCPLVQDYYARCRAHRIDVTGERREVRCDVGRNEDHRPRSAFLHQCDLLAIPMFEALRTQAWNAPDPDAHWKGPDLVTGDNLHLLGETWCIQWREPVDDRLLELSDHGATVPAAAAAVLRERLVDAEGDARATTQLLLHAARMALTDVFEDVLAAVERALDVDHDVPRLAAALRDFMLLHTYRDALATRGDARLAQTIAALFQRAALRLPSLAHARHEAVRDALDAMQTLVRAALGFEAVELDRALLAEKIAETVAVPDASPAVRGAGYGVLYSLGSVRERAVTDAFEAYLRGGPERVTHAGSFLDGLFLSARGIFMGSPRLLRAVHAVIAGLDWQTFKVLLPDLRRAFTQFIPTEIDAISKRLDAAVRDDDRGPEAPTIPEVPTRAHAPADRRAAALLEGWW